MNGALVWDVSTFLFKDGVGWGCGVILDGKTGEMLLSNVITGGNG